MKYALICPNEPSSGGWRIAQVETTTFPVSECMYWIECSDEVVADEWYVNTETGEITKAPLPVPSAPIQQQNPNPNGTTGLQTV